jgi:WhiB family redox-sensing transcriptional regulator
MTWTPDEAAAWLSDKQRSWVVATNLEDWAEWAECKDTHVDLFFPADQGPDQYAKEICRQCPVEADCLAYALNLPEEHGLWGGLSARERKPLVIHGPRTLALRLVR